MSHAYRYCSKVLNLFSGIDRHGHSKFCEGFLAGSVVDAAVSISHESTTLSVLTFI
jgi:hypothetical protein